MFETWEQDSPSSLKIFPHSKNKIVLLMSIDPKFVKTNIKT